jgi:hypothetical protein
LLGLNVTGQVELIDLRPSAAPVLLGRYDIERPFALDLAYHNNILYLALGPRGLAALTSDFQ